MEACSRTETRIFYAYSIRRQQRCINRNAATAPAPFPLLGLYTLCTEFALVLCPLFPPAVPIIRPRVLTLTSSRYAHPWRSQDPFVFRLPATSRALRYRPFASDIVRNITSVTIEDDVFWTVGNPGKCRWHPAMTYNGSWNAHSLINGIGLVIRHLFPCATVIFRGRNEYGRANAYLGKGVVNCFENITRAHGIKELE